MDPLISIIIAVIISWLFASASWMKCKESSHMLEVIKNYQVLPFTPQLPHVMTLASLEMMIALSTLIPATRQYGASAATLILLMYGYAIGINIKRGRDKIECGCSRLAKRKNIGPALLWRNATLALIASIAVIPTTARTLMWLDYLILLFTGLLFILIYQIVETLLENNHKLQML